MTALPAWSAEAILEEVLVTPRSASLPVPDLRRIERPGWVQIITPSFRTGGLNEVMFAALADNEADAVIDATIACRRLHARDGRRLGPRSCAAPARPMTETIDKLWFMATNDRVCWRTGRNAPTEYPLSAFPGWSLIAPWRLSDDDRLEPPGCFRLAEGDDFLVDSGGILLRYQGPELDEDSQVPVETAHAVLHRLRYFSRQFRISSQLRYWGEHGPLANKPPGSIFDDARQGVCRYRDYAVPTAVTAAHLAAVARAAPDFDVPIHVEIMLDALQAHTDGDYRKAILFAAISAETGALQALDDAYQQGLSQRDPGLRVVSIDIAGGGQVEKDPIEEHLRNATEFKHLLHARPLYLLRRSLLLELPDVFRCALKLYKTRNKLVHQGRAPVDDEHIPMTRDGSIDALETATRVLGWFGDSGPYIAWRGFVPVGVVGVI